MNRGVDHRVSEDPKPYKSAKDVPGDMHLAKEVATERWRPGKASDRFRRVTWCGLTQVSYSASPAGNRAPFKATYNQALVTCGQCLTKKGEADEEETGPGAE